MADEVRVEVLGEAELAAGTKQLAGRIERAAPADLERVADQVAGKVSGTVPRLTGALAGSLHAERAAAGASVSMGDGVPYAQFVEFGGRGHPHNPSGNYLYPAAQDAGPQLQQAGERTAIDEIGRMTWPTPG